MIIIHAYDHCTCITSYWAHCSKIEGSVFKEPLDGGGPEDSPKVKFDSIKERALSHALVFQYCKWFNLGSSWCRGYAPCILMLCNMYNKYVFVW